MIVAFHLALIIIAQEFFRDGFGRAEIKARTGNGFQSFTRNTHLIDRQPGIGQQLELMLTDV
ncbi:hypothetical protein D3C72_2096140 [compost metagenome]